MSDSVTVDTDQRVPLIGVSGLTKEYRNGGGVVSVLHGVDLRVFPGEMVAVMGPSGSGKSTLLFILGLFLAPTRGTYEVLGEDVLNLDRQAQARFRRRFVGFVFQSCNLIEGSDVYENLEMPLIYAGMRRRERHLRVQDAMDRVGLSHRIHHPANQLSGGEQQRVAVARALVNNPKIILADEPTGQLDRNNSRMVMEYFRRFIADGTTAMMIVTHDREVAAHCTSVYRLEDGVLLPCQKE
jgi:putative ABC transport system ATP-binding protein